jgi:hypothetical protein
VGPRGCVSSYGKAGRKARVGGPGAHPVRVRRSPGRLAPAVAGRVATARRCRSRHARPGRAPRGGRPVARRTDRPGAAAGARTLGATGLVGAGRGLGCRHAHEVGHRRPGPARAPCAVAALVHPADRDLGGRPLPEGRLLPLPPRARRHRRARQGASRPGPGGARGRSRAGLDAAARADRPRARGVRRRAMVFRPSGSRPRSIAPGSAARKSFSPYARRTGRWHCSRTRSAPSPSGAS